MYRNISKGQGACFRCGSNYGDMPANVYLVHDQNNRVVKVGITNAHAHRLTQYPGWKIVEVVKTFS